MKKLLVFLFVFACAPSPKIDERLLAIKQQLLTAQYDVNTTYFAVDAKAVVEKDYFYFLKIYNPSETLNNFSLFVIFSIDKNSENNIANYPSVGIIDEPINLTNGDIDHANRFFAGLSFKIVSSLTSPYFLLYVRFETDIVLELFLKIPIIYQQ